MATSSIDKGLYAAPLGMEQEMDAPIYFAEDYLKAKKKMTLDNFFKFYKI